LLERAETYGARARTDHSRRCSQHRRHGRRSAAGTDRRRSLRAAGRGPGRKTRFLTIARTGPAAVDRGEEVYGSRRRSGLAAAYRVSRYISGPAPKWRASPSRGVAIAHRGRARLQSMRFVPAKTFWRGQADKVWLRSRWRTALRPTDANRSLPSRCAQCPRGGRATGLIRACSCVDGLPWAKTFSTSSSSFRTVPTFRRKSAFSPSPTTTSACLGMFNGASPNGDSLARIESVGVSGNGVNHRSPNT